MDLNEAIDRCQTGDPDETAAAVFEVLRVPKRWREVFYAVVRDECRRHYVNRVRDLVDENAARHDADQEVSDTQRPVVGSGRAAYLDERFHNGTTWVLWGEATIADHQFRIDRQLRLVCGIQRDIARHREAIAAIEAAGVSCLNEIEDAA